MLEEVTKPGFSIWATVCKMVSPMLPDRCPACLSVLSLCNAGVFWPNSWIKVKRGTEVGLCPDHIVLDGDPAPPTLVLPPSFRPMSDVAKSAGWTNMSLGMEVGLGPGHIVLNGDPAPPRKGHSPAGPPSCLLWPNGRPSQLLLTTCLCLLPHAVFFCL